MRNSRLKRRLGLNISKKKIIIPLLVSGVIFIVVTISVKFKVFIIGSFECRISGNPCAEIDKTLISSYLGSSLFTFKPDKLQSELRINPLYKDAKVKLVFPNVIQVEIYPEIDLFQIGLIHLPPVDSEPVVTGIDTATISAMFDDSILRQFEAVTKKPYSVVSLTSRGDLVETDKQAQHYIIVDTLIPPAEELAILYQVIKDVTLSGLTLKPLWMYQDYIVGLYQDSYVILPINKNSFATLASLQQILSQSTMKINHSVIDLRYEKPLIRPLNK